MWGIPMNEPQPQQQGALEWEEHLINFRRGTITFQDIEEYARSRPASAQCNADSFRAIIEQNREEAAAQARVARDTEWATALNALISTESVKVHASMVDMVYSYRIAQIVQSLREAQR